MNLACGIPLLLVCVTALADPPATLPGTRPLTGDGDLSKVMLDGLHRFAEREIDASVKTRATLWKRDTSSREAYERSVEANRASFRRIIGVVDPRLPARMERFGGDDDPALVAECDTFRAYQVRWPVLEGVYGEGLLLEPKREVVGQVVALPDADQTPEQVTGLAPGVATESQFARRLAANGFRVVVPTLVSRGIAFSGIGCELCSVPAGSQLPTAKKGLSVGSAQGSA